MTYSIIIPIYNEERTLPILLKKLKYLDKSLQIIIVDDGSNDQTQAFLKDQDRFKIIRNEINQGKGASIRNGISLAKNDNIILIDGDIEVDIEEIPILINRYEKSDKNVLIGVRWNKNSKIKYEINSLGNYFINSVFNLLYRSNLNDVLCCVKILNTKLIRSLDIKSNGFSIEVETMAKLVKKNISFEEVKITYNRRTSEEGKKLKISDSLNIMLTMFRLYYK